MVQLLIGIGFLVPRTPRAAVVASVAWAGGVWFLGEGLGGLAGSSASMLTGAPGAALLYAVLALAAWPRSPGVRAGAPRWFVAVWAALWTGLGGLALLPANRSAGLVAAQVRGSVGMVPPWLGHIDTVTAAATLRLGPVAVVLLVSNATSSGR